MTRKPTHVAILFFFAAVTVSACTSEPSGGGAGEAGGLHQENTPPSVHAITFQPNPILLSEPVGVFADALDPDHDQVTFRYQWFVNNKRVPDETRSVLSPSMLKRGDRVRVEVVPHDGKVEGVSGWVEQVVGNTPPMVSSLQFETENFRLGDRLQVKVEATDADSDEIRYVFRWWRNGAVAEGEENFLDTAGFKQKDAVMVEVVPHDATGQGKPFRIDPLYIGNSQPQIVSVPPVATGRERYEYAVKATDLDGDTMNYQLEDAPSGMTINRETGHILWDMSRASAGTHRVRVIAEDGQGGKAFQEFAIALAPPDPPKPAGA
ncbi:MAG: Ig domain-containing protein [Nitrospira sp.]|nr:Ig domain-containing protein [Nitrospira sp.]